MDVRHALTKHGGNLGTDGSVAFMFKHCGQLVCEPGVVSSIVNTGSNHLGAGTPFAPYYNPSSSTGGPANLAAGSRVIFLVKYR